MTNAVITWVEKELGILKTEITTLKPEIIAWAYHFLNDIAPVIKQACDDAVLAALSVPGSGSVRFAAALAVATADLLAKGIPVAENDLKAGIQIAYNALPDSVKSSAAAQAAVTAANTEVDNAGAQVQADLTPVPAA